ncbi:MAG: GNAT family N-acetyltransferase, partial [Chloroflexi bacterium]|nr:GNAT family N-acetyltransferase [Chloroflexota bacterium]
MEIRFGEYALRSWSWDDAPALVRYANNRNIWLNVRDAFPHPYTKADADAWLDLVVGQDRPTSFAIATESEAIGGMGFTLKDDVRRRTAEIGYWLARTPSGEGESLPMPSGPSSTTPSPVLISYVSWRT